MRREIKAQLLEEIKEKVSAVLGITQHDSFNQVISQIGIESLSKLDSQSKKQLLSLTKRIYDSTPGAHQVNQEIKEFILRRIAEVLKVDLAHTDTIWAALVDLYQAHILLSDKSRVTAFSYDILFGNELPAQMRTLLWESTLASELNNKQFYKYDHQTKRVRLQDQMRDQIETTLKILQVKIRSDTVANIGRLIEYLFRKHKKIVAPPIYYLACNLGNVMDSYTEFKINALGGYFVSLLQLADFYSSSFSEQQHIEMIIKALELVDADSVNLFKKSYQQQPKQVVKYFKQYVNSLGCAVLNASTAQYMIDQLLIKPRNKLDIHLNFAMLILVLTSDVEEGKQQPEENSKEKSKKKLQPQSSSDRNIQIPQKDLFDYLAKSRLIEVATYAKVINNVYDGIVLYETTISQLPSQITKRQNMPLKESAINSLLSEYKQVSRRAHKKTNMGHKMTNLSRPTVKMTGKMSYGLISPPVNMDE